MTTSAGHPAWSHADASAVRAEQRWELDGGALDHHPDDTAPEPPPQPQEHTVHKTSLDALAREQLAAATAAASHRAASTVFGGHEHVMRQTVIALTAGAELSEHQNPGEATVLVLSGRVELVCGVDVWSGRTGDLLVVPPALHSLRAVTDAAVLLTAVPTART